jgi:PAS domain S-box-containing protein
MPQIVWTATAEGFTDYYNQRWYELTGQEKENPGGDDSFVPYLHPDDRQRCLDAWYAAVRSGKPYEIEYRFKFPPWEDYHWLLGRALPIRNADGNIVRWYGTCTDIDEMKRAEEKLERAVARRTTELSESNSQLESIVYSIAHDLRNPLRAVEALSKILENEYSDSLDETGRDIVNRINRSADHMDKLLLDLLEFGRAARAEMELGKVSVESAWEAAVSQCRHQVDETSAKIEVSSSLPLVKAHQGTLVQVLENLLSNALRFVREGVQPHICLRAEERNGRVRLWLIDNGIGISPEHHERIFRVFERLHNTHYGGTGIGLSIVRKGVERMGGRVGVESIPGQGSRFWIELLPGTEETAAEDIGAH